MSPKLLLALSLLSYQAIFRVFCYCSSGLMFAVLLFLWFRQVHISGEGPQLVVLIVLRLALCVEGSLLWCSGGLWRVPESKPCFLLMQGKCPTNSMYYHSSYYLGMISKEGNLLNIIPTLFLVLEPLKELQRIPSSLVPDGQLSWGPVGRAHPVYVSSHSKIEAAS